MNDDTRLSPASRITACLLATIWLAVGVACLLLAAYASRWLFVAIGAGCLGYGLAWVRVVRLDRRLGLREMLMLDVRDKKSRN